MAFERTASDVEAPQYDVPDSGGLQQFGQVHHAVVGEAVADAEDAQRVGPLRDRVVGEFLGVQADADQRQSYGQQKAQCVFHNRMVGMVFCCIIFMSGKIPVPIQN